MEILSVVFGNPVLWVISSNCRQYYIWVNMNVLHLTLFGRFIWFEITYIFVNHLIDSDVNHRTHTKEFLEIS